MVEPLKTDKGKQGLGKALDGISRFARNTSKQLAEQTSDLKDVAAGTVERLTAKKPDPYEEAVAEYNSAFTGQAPGSGVTVL